MKLYYTDDAGNETYWFVEVLEEGIRFKMVDETGKAERCAVNVTKNGFTTIAIYDGFIVEGNDVYGVALLTENPKTRVGHSPRII